MRLLQGNKIVLASCIVVIPLSFYGGLALKERCLSNESVSIPGEDGLIHKQATRARIIQLEHERKELLEQNQNLDDKISELKKRMGS